MPVILIALFVLFSCLADLWPVKKTYFFVYSTVDDLLTMDLQVHPAMRYTAGNGIHSGESLLYVLTVKLFHLLIPFRVACLRAVSVCSTVVSLFFLYLTGKRLFSRPVALLFLFLLVTSPIYLESMRAFGFIPLTNTIVVMAIYFFTASLRGRRPCPKLVLSALFGLMTLSLYLPGKLVIILPVLFFLFFPRKYWPRLLLYLFLVIIPVMAVDFAAGDVVFDIKYALEADGEFLMYGPTISCLTDRLQENAALLAGYLLQINRSYFIDPRAEIMEDSRSRLFNVMYTPFFFIGLGACLWRLFRRKEEGFIAAAWFTIFFLTPLLSTELTPRRFILALNPMYLMIAIGLVTCYRFFRARLPSPVARRYLAGSFLLLLIGTGLCDLHEFFFLVSRPSASYSRKELKKITEMIDKEGRKAAFIVIDETRVADLIWGNPYFARPLIGPDITRKFVYLNQLQDIRAYFPPAGEGVLYLFSLKGTGQSGEMADAIRQWDQDDSGALAVSTVAGTGFYTVLSTGGSSVPMPEDWAPAGMRHLKSSMDIPLRVSSEYSTVAGGIRLRDKRPETFWRISNREVGQPAWIMIDLGPEGERAIRVLRALPRENHPEEFFRNAELLGSRDGITWKNIASVTQDIVPRGEQWREWDFKNEEKYRYYKLIIHDGHSGRNNVFLSLAELDISGGDDRGTEATAGDDQ